MPAQPAEHRRPELGDQLLARVGLLVRARRQLAVKPRGVPGGVHRLVEAGRVVALHVMEALPRRQRDRV